MKTNFCKFFLLIILLFQNIISLIVIPFRISEYNQKEKGKYNVTDLINEYLFVDIFTTIEIGSPPQKVTTLISPDEKTFSLSSEICEKKSLDSISDYGIVSKMGLDLNNLKSYKNQFDDSIFENYLDKNYNIGLILETISLYDSLNLKSQPVEWYHNNEK